MPISLEEFRKAKGASKRIPYQEIKTWTEKLMAAGQAPSEKDLQEKFGCSLRTVSDRAAEAKDRFSYRTINTVKYFIISERTF